MSDSLHSGGHGRLRFVVHKLDRAKLRKSAGNAYARATRLVVADLNADFRESNIETLTYKQLSRYVVEYVLACKVGARFLLCISKDLDAHHLNVLSTAEKQKENNGGDEYPHIWDGILLLKAWIEWPPMHDELALCMSKAGG